MSDLSNKEKEFVSFIDDNDEKVEGFFRVKKISNNYIKIDTGKNIITIPMHRVLKIKEVKE